MNDPIKKLADIYDALENGQKAVVRDVKVNILQMQDTIRDLESTLARQPLPEAPASATAKVVDPATQTEWLLTFRFHTEDELLEGVARITGKLPALGVVGFDAYVDERRAERTGAGGQGPGDSSLPTPETRNPTPLSFRAETLTKSTEGDKTYYKVKGGSFEKFGVTIWPEALQAAGFDLDTLAGVTSLKGYTAYYVLNDKGKPAKVVGLQPA